MPPARIRRSRDAAREAILEAAEALFLAEGADGVVVQKVAAAVGVTDAAVHYHFDNRLGLMEALLHHTGRRLAAEITAATGPSGGPLDLAAVSRSMRESYRDKGAARMVMWLRLAGWRPRGAGMLSPLIARSEAEGAAGPEETRRLIALLNSAHVAIAILGDALLRAADLPADESGQEAFLDWVTQLVARGLAAPLSGRAAL